MDLGCSTALKDLHEKSGSAQKMTSVMAWPIACVVEEVRNPTSIVLKRLLLDRSRFTRLNATSIYLT